MVELARVFDTYAGSGELETFIAQEMPDDLIIIAACKDECSRKLSTVVK